MLQLRNMTLGAIAIAGLAGLAGSPVAQADERCEACYVPAHYETRLERVETPGRWVDEERVVETPGHYETRSERIEIPGRFERVERRDWVPGHWAAGTGPVAEIGNGRFRVAFGLPCREWVPGHYVTRCEQVWIPARCERREVEVWVACSRRVVVERVFKPGCSVERPIQVWVPARYERRPATIVLRPRC